jgi:hypothetical protein
MESEICNSHNSTRKLDKWSPEDTGLIGASPIGRFA